MVVLHYANISRNNASGVSVIVPQIANSQVTFAQVGFYNYGSECFDTVDRVVRLDKAQGNDDYHCFQEPFNRPDVVVFHSPFGLPKSVRITKMLKKDGIPYVIVPHGCFSKFAMKKKSLKKNIARLLFMDRIVRDAASMQYLSEGEKKASVYNSECFIVPNGVSVPERVSKEQKEFLELSFIGRKDLYHKGLDLFIEACGIAKEQLRNCVRINIYGPVSNNQTASVSQLITEYGVEDFVFDLPAVFGDDKKNVYVNTDVFVLTSRFEGQPVAILESWSYGVPTLVTPGTNVSEECSENGCGWSVAADPASIAEKLIYLTKNREEIAQCAENAYCYVQKTYSWENVSKLYCAEYQKIKQRNNI